MRLNKAGKDEVPTIRIANSVPLLERVQSNSFCKALTERQNIQRSLKGNSQVSTSCEEKIPENNELKTGIENLDF